jgi:hypothetical protein
MQVRPEISAGGRESIEITQQALRSYECGFVMTYIVG